VRSGVLTSKVHTLFAKWVLILIVSLWQALLGKGSGAHATEALHGEEYAARKIELMKAFSDAALETYWDTVIAIVEVHYKAYGLLAFATS